MTTVSGVVLSQWARRRLVVAPEADAHEVRAAFLRALAREQFVPEPATTYAFRVLQGAPSATDADLGKQQAAIEIEADLRREVDAYVQAFEHRGGSQANERGRVLFEECYYFPSLRERLERSRSPASAVLRAADESQDEFLRMLRELNGLSRVQAARRRQAMIQELAPNMSHWRLVATEVARRHPDSVQLDPVFCEYFKERVVNVRTDDRTWQVTLPGTIGQPVSWSSGAPASPQPQPQSSSPPSWTWGSILFIVMLIGALTRGCGGASPRFDREPPAMPKFDFQNRFVVPPAGKKAEFKRGEFEDLLEKIRQKRKLEERPAP